jgi:hypothetical protein
MIKMNKELPLLELLEKALKENEDFVNSSRFAFGEENDALLCEAKEKASSLLDYGMQFVGMLEIASSLRIININKNASDTLRMNLDRFYTLSDNLFHVKFSRQEFLKLIRSGYHALKPYFMISQQGVVAEAKLSSYSAVLGRLRELLNIDETTFTCLCSLSLFEIAINKKLKDLGEKTEGNFDDRCKRLVEVVRKKEKRSLQTILPPAMYKARNLLLHGGHEHKPTAQESEQIIRWIEDFMVKLFERK